MGNLEVYCPECNKLFKSEEAMFHHYDKMHPVKEELTKEQQPIKKLELLVSDEMSDNEIKKKIVEDMNNLRMHEVGTKWMYLGSLLSFNSTEQILASGLKAIIDQNKIIIRQNELMLRAISRTKQNSKTNGQTKLLES